MKDKDKKEIQEIQKLLSMANRKLQNMAYPLSTINKYTIQLGHASYAVSLAQSILTEIKG